MKIFTILLCIIRAAPVAASESHPTGTIQFSVEGSINESFNISSEKSDRVVCASSPRDNKFYIWGSLKANQYKTAILFILSKDSVPTGVYDFNRDQAEHPILLISSNSSQYLWAPSMNPECKITFSHDEKTLRGDFNCGDLVEVTGGLKTEKMRASTQGTIECEILHWAN